MQRVQTVGLRSKYQGINLMKVNNKGRGVSGVAAQTHQPTVQTQIPSRHEGNLAICYSMNLAL